MKFKDFLYTWRTRLFLFITAAAVLGASFGVISIGQGGGRFVLEGAASLVRDAFADMTGSRGDTTYVPLGSEAREGLTALSSSSQKANEVLPAAPIAKIIEASKSECSFDSSHTSAHKIIFSEIAWMGSLPQKGESAGAGSAREWIELKNISAQNISLAGWKILNDSKKIEIGFVAGENISAGGFYLLERTRDETLPQIKADKIYSGSLSNSGDSLKIFNSNCNAEDSIEALNGWPGGNNKTKQTLERNLKNLNWQTSELPGGTPGK